jgi:hypothetical protein
MTWLMRLILEISEVKGVKLVVGSVNVRDTVDGKTAAKERKWYAVLIVMRWNTKQASHSYWTPYLFLHFLKRVAYSAETLVDTAYAPREFRADESRVSDPAVFCNLFCGSLE